MTLVTPDKLYGPLFEAVQLSRLFSDSKTFVDAEPRRSPKEIVADFEQASTNPDFNLTGFVSANFVWTEPGKDGVLEDRLPIREHIDKLWDLLHREPAEPGEYSSLIGLPYGYVVPGGRFREIFYWDSYFTMLGLAAAGRRGIVEDMVNNFAFLIDEIGFVPNGNRNYFATRSQPPFFALMVELLAESSGDEQVYVRYLPQLLAEYRFWMRASESHQEDRALERVVRADNDWLNRYWGGADQPRQEGYAEDTRLAATSGREPSKLFRDLRAGCESGWDFSSRWLADGRSLSAIETTEIVPVDLNCLMYNLEKTIAQSLFLEGDEESSDRFRQLALRRADLVRKRFFDADVGIFADLGVADFAPTKRLSLAGAFPLYLEIATRQQAAATAEVLEKLFLKPGGWTTSPYHTGQQWDSPNGWAPLQWVVYVGLRNYGYDELAREGARRWVACNLAVYESTGSMVEKYDVVQSGMPGGGGEYSVQSGFGWTNGVLLKFLDELGL